MQLNVNLTSKLHDKLNQALKSAAVLTLLAGSHSTMATTNTDTPANPNWNATCSPSQSGNGKAKLCVNEILSTNEKLVNGSYTMNMQSDGNLVIYNSGNAIWSTGNGGSNGEGPSFLKMQSDTNLVTYRNSGGSTWHSNTANRGKVSHLQLMIDGNAVVFCKNGNAIWSSKKGRLASSCTAYDFIGPLGGHTNFKNKPQAEHVSWDDLPEQTDIVAASIYFQCQPGSQCGSISTSVGGSSCETTYVEVGFDWQLPIPELYGTLNIAGTTQNTWETCSTESTTITCYNTEPGTEVRAEIHGIKKSGIKQFSGDTYDYKSPGDKKCDLGGSHYREFLGAPGAYEDRCTGQTRTVQRTGYWPYKDTAICSLPRPY